MSEQGNKTLEKLRMQSIKAIMDVILLSEIRGGTTSGYDAISAIHKKFGVLLSSGTVYAHIYALEREGLIKSDYDLKKRVYELTEKGEKMLRMASKANIELLKTLTDELTLLNST